jgi:hypothetical protein
MSGETVARNTRSKTGLLREEDIPKLEERRQRRSIRSNTARSMTASPNLVSQSEGYEEHIDINALTMTPMPFDISHVIMTPNDSPQSDLYISNSDKSVDTVKEIFDKKNCELQEANVKRKQPDFRSPQTIVTKRFGFQSTLAESFDKQIQDILANIKDDNCTIVDKSSK